MLLCIFRAVVFVNLPFIHLHVGLSQVNSPVMLSIPCVALKSNDSKTIPGGWSHNFFMSRYYT